MRKNIRNIIGWFLGPLCFAGCGPVKKTKNDFPYVKKSVNKKSSGAGYTSPREFSAYAQREEEFSELLEKFKKSSEYNERSLDDLVKLIELEVKSTDYMLMGPRWHLRSIINQRQDLLKTVMPNVKKIYNMCVAVSEHESKELVKRNKSDYVRSVRTSLKRCYAKTRLLQTEKVNESDLYNKRCADCPCVSNSVSKKVC